MSDREERAALLERADGVGCDLASYSISAILEHGESFQVGHLVIGLARELRAAEAENQRLRTANAELQAAIACGPKTDGSALDEPSTSQVVDDLREMATRKGVPAYRLDVLALAANRLETLEASYLDVCSHEQQRDLLAARLARVEKIRIRVGSMAEGASLDPRRVWDALGAALGESK